MATPRKLPEKRPGKAGGKRDENRKQRAEAIAQAGLGLFLERGIEGVTIDEIAERAGTAKGNFYRYFDDKAQLVESLLLPMARTTRSAMRKCGVDLAKAKTNQGVTDAYASLATTLIASAVQYRDEVRLFLQEHRAPATAARASVRALSDELQQGAFRLSQAAKDHGVIAVKDPRISALAVIGAIEHLALVLLRGDIPDILPLDIASTLIGMVLDGLRPRTA